MNTSVLPALKKQAIVVGILATALCAQNVQANTVAHWRFEDQSSLGVDSSGSNNNLTVHGVSTPGYVSSPFSNPVPGTGAVNNGAAALDYNDRHYFSMADNASLNFQSFTYEMYFQLDAFRGGNSAVLGGQWNTLASGNTDLNWQLLVANNGEVRMQLGTAQSGGSSHVNFASGYTIEQGKQYYIAASVNPSGSASVGTEVIFYIMNLTDGEELQTITRTSTSVYNLNSAAGGNFAIGTNYNEGAAYDYRTFSGLIDEVRLSEGALGADQLLIIPEPRTYGMLMSAGILTLLLFRRKNGK